MNNWIVYMCVIKSSQPIRIFDNGRFFMIGKFIMDYRQIEHIGIDISEKVHVTEQ